jgi:Uma2 family endonuclease
MSKPLRYTRRMAPPALMTADELLRLNLPNRRTELVDGRLFVREPAGLPHGEAAARLAAALVAFVYPRNLGRVYGAETGFKLRSDPDTVRAPDASFVGHSRLAEQPTKGFGVGGPDLVVEVLSPGDRPGEVREKVSDWLASGCRLVSVIDPVRRTARIHRPDGTQDALSPTGELDGEDVLPGFRCALADVL